MLILTTIIPLGLAPNFVALLDFKCQFDYTDLYYMLLLQFSDSPYQPFKEVMILRYSATEYSVSLLILDLKVITVIVYSIAYI
ncbi:MAG: hypothetical protein ACR5KW_01170 [Wolbachia sp.]